MAVAVTMQSTFRAETPEPLFTAGEVGVRLGGSRFGGPDYDVTADGQRFVMIQQESDDYGVTVVQNWIKEFEDRE